jgi:hypothetical protein
LLFAAYVKPHAAGCIIVKGAPFWVMIVWIVPTTPAWLFFYYNYIIVIPSAIIRRGIYNCGGVVVGMCMVVAMAVMDVVAVIVAHTAIDFATS